MVSKLIQVHIEKEPSDLFWVIRKDDPIWALNAPTIKLLVDEEFIDRYESIQLEYFTMVTKLNELHHLQEDREKFIDKKVQLPPHKKLK